MKTVFAALLVGMMFMMTACSTTEVSVSNDSATIEESASAQEMDTPPQPPEDMGNRVMGKITAVSASGISLELASMEGPGRPGGRGEMPVADGTPPEKPEDGAVPADGEATRPERPEGTPPGRGGERAGGMSMTYSGETADYTFSDSIRVTKGMGDGTETLDVSDLAVDDVVMLELDENDAVIVVRVMDGQDAMPPSELPVEEEASEDAALQG